MRFHKALKFQFLYVTYLKSIYAHLSNQTLLNLQTKMSLVYLQSTYSKANLYLLEKLV